MKKPMAPTAGRASARIYASPTLVLLAMDWPGGAERSDFLGFAILRAPGFAQGEKDGYLLNKIGFSAPAKDAQPLPSNLAPFQKFLWWDSAINPEDRGRTFTYTVTPVCGTGPNDLVLQHEAEAQVEVTVPAFERDDIWTCFNRAVVSSQAFRREFPDPAADLDRCMAWLANGLQEAFPAVLEGAQEVTGAIYHLTDNEWVVPALKAFNGKLSLVYEDQPKKDTTDRPAVELLRGGGAHFESFPRSKTNIMHDKFLVDRTGERVLAGSANFTPEGLTSQANLLHIFHSPELTQLFADRAALLQGDPTIGETAQHAGWSQPVAVGKARVRVFFSPEPKDARESIDTVVQAVKTARSSVAFCMFDPTDPALLAALLATGDEGKLLYGLLNSISDPKGKTNKRSASGEPPRKPGAATQVKVTLFNRSRQDRKVLAYSYFRPGNSPAGFLPEFSTVDLTAKSTLGPSKPGGKGKRPPPAVHIHHKFIVIDAETSSPTIFTGSANFSKNSTNFNDENLLEITHNPELAQTYFAEFMRLYEHYRARALWDLTHGRGAATKKGAKKAATQPRGATPFTLKTTRDGWVKGAYQAGTPEYLARTALAAADSIPQRVASKGTP